MKYIFASLFLGMALISGNSVAQTAPAKEGTMDKMDTGAYSGPYYTNNEVNPLIILKDGAEGYKIDKSTLLKEIDKDWINKVDILKDKKATDAFGEEARDGVVILTFNGNVEAAELFLAIVRKNNKQIAVPADI